MALKSTVPELSNPLAADERPSGVDLASGRKPTGLSAIAYAKIRAVETRDALMARAVDELMAVAPYTRQALIARLESGHRDAKRQRQAPASTLDAHETILRFDAAVQCYGRLLFILRFGKCAADASANERRLCERIAMKVSECSE